MRRLWIMSGLVAYWLTLPGLRIYLRNSQRTRVLIRSNQKVLVVRGWLSDGKWSLPGGGLHRRERAIDGAIRELREETGILLPTDALTAKGNFQFRNHGLNFSYNLFIAEVADTYTLKQQKVEITDVEWLLPIELSDDNATPDVIKALQT